jgi:RluA family pseudouridine synthase
MTFVPIFRKTQSRLHWVVADTMDTIISSKVKQHFAGMALDAYLARRFTYLTIDTWRQHIADGRITLNGQPSLADAILRSDDDVAFAPHPFREPEADLSFSFVYDDQWLIGVNKPGNLLVHRAGKALTHNLIYLIRSGAGGKAYPDAGLVNRLDRETSGVVAVAKDAESLRLMHRIMQTGSMRKEYLAIVRGHVEGKGRIDAPLAKDTRAAIASLHTIDARSGKAAITDYEGVKILENGCSFVRIYPQTGRTHQIRVHLASIGHPVLGDMLYGCENPGENASAGACRNLISRQALHCARIAFEHPMTGRECVMQADLPEDMRRLIYTSECRGQTDEKTGTQTSNPASIGMEHS